MQSNLQTYTAPEPVEMIVSPNGVLCFDDREFRCALGRNGIIDADAKIEGDGKTPAGVWRLRYVMYRADRRASPHTDLPVTTISFSDGWCDDPAHADYNRPVRLPFSASHEKLCRKDGIYDLIVVLGHNDDPPIPGKGSAVFMHIARPDYTGTEGCIALAEPDLETVLSMCTPESYIRINM
ncbi:L,D-transpeptidase family protein [Thalassospira alkalitolerans]|uniref:L,D-transpeptidase family protein n=1 Tax=Thalassospira alkalitolerans TaxID=1293890 RepID=UPI003AA89C09